VPSELLGAKIKESKFN